MDEKHTASASSEERPPPGSDEAIGKVREAIRNCGDLWDHVIGLRRNDPKKWPVLLHLAGLLTFIPHYLEVIEALRDLGWIRVSGARSGTPADLTNPDVKKTYPEDFFQEYVADARKQEMRQRRKLALRRRRGY
jgi:hypothetical protein